MGHAVEGGGFYHGVVCHVGEDEFLSTLERLWERVFADDIAGEAGGAAEVIGVGVFVW